MRMSIHPSIYLYTHTFTHNYIYINFFIWVKVMEVYTWLSLWNTRGLWSERELLFITLCSSERLIYLFFCQDHILPLYYKKLV